MHIPARPRLRQTEILRRDPNGIVRVFMDHILIRRRYWSAHLAQGDWKWPEWIDHNGKIDVGDECGRIESMNKVLIRGEALQ